LDPAGGAARGGGAANGAVRDGVVAAPQFAQNFASGELGVPQF